MRLLDVVTIICAGLMIGVEVAVSCFVNPVIWKLDDEAQGDALRRFARMLGKVMPIWYSSSLVFMIAEAYLRRHETALPLLLVAIGVWVALIVYSIAVLVPINDRIAAMVEGPLPDSLRKEHQRWDRLHRGRVLLLVAAMVCLTLGILGMH
jgi:Domain of unknown function (DUF1772)